MQTLLQTLERHLLNAGMDTFPTQTGGILVQSHYTNVCAVASMHRCWNGEQILTVTLSDMIGISNDRTVTHGSAMNALAEITTFFAKN